MTNEERKAALEAVIYAADEPATLAQLAAALGEDKLVIQAAVDELIAGYAAEDRGVEVRAVAGGYKFYTKAQHHDVVRRFIKSLRPPLRLTMPALETLAVISYKQPVTGPEIGEIRGVNTSGVLKTLLDKRLITTAGRKEVMGRPILYKTSKEFLMRFGLSDLGELPSLKEFEALAREALGSDEGVAAGDGSEAGALGENSSDERTLEGGMSGGENNSSETASEKSLIEAEVEATNEGMPAGLTDEAPLVEEEGHDVAITAKGSADGGEAQAELVEAEKAATDEGMPAGETDEAPKAAVAGE